MSTDAIATTPDGPTGPRGPRVFHDRLRSFLVQSPADWTTRRAPLLFAAQALIVVPEAAATATVVPTRHVAAASAPMTAVGRDRPGIVDPLDSVTAPRRDHGEHRG
jgi:hypothetical protein